MTFAQLQEMLKTIALNPNVKPDTPVYMLDYSSGYPVYVYDIRVNNDPVRPDEDEFSVLIS